MLNNNKNDARFLDGEYRRRVEFSSLRALLRARPTTASRARPQEPQPACQQRRLPSSDLLPTIRKLGRCEFVVFDELLRHTSIQPQTRDAHALPSSASDGFLGFQPMIFVMLVIRTFFIIFDRRRWRAPSTRCRARPIIQCLCAKAMSTLAGRTLLSYMRAQAPGDGRRGFGGAREARVKAIAPRASAAGDASATSDDAPELGGDGTVSMLVATTAHGHGEPGGAGPGAAPARAARTGPRGPLVSSPEARELPRRVGDKPELVGDASPGGPARRRRRRRRRPAPDAGARAPAAAGSMLCERPRRDSGGRRTAGATGAPGPGCSAHC